jgi:CDP-diacylglycerol--glycerol-3-phosphate 3-phosphatidyltransferase
VFRVLLTPVLVVLLTIRSDSAQDVAAGIFVFGAATDGLDGYLARRWETRTRTGVWLDPLADKILVLAAVLTLSILGRFPWWATSVIAAREAAISVVRALLGSRGRSLPASRGAKVKTATQIVAITLYILPFGPGADGIRLAVVGLAILLTVVTGAQYVVEAVAWLRADRSGPPAALRETSA